MDHNEFFRQAVVHICGSLDIKVALGRCLEYLARFMPADQMELNVLRPDLHLVEVVTQVSRNGTQHPSPTHPMPANALGEVERMDELGVEGVLGINHPRRHQTLRELCARSGYSLDMSVMVLRLAVEGQQLGAVLLKSQREGAFTPEHAELFRLTHDPFAIALQNALKHREVTRLQRLLDDDNRYLRQQLRERSGAEIVGADFGLREAMELVSRVAPLDSPVLLLGETGVGKEVLAGAIHQSSPRRDGPLITVNCGAIPESLIDSELFGHEKGAFTGATGLQRGRFERAQGGTIFLDEVGELPPAAQVRLLRVLQHHTIERVGGSQPIPVDIRVISATHRNLALMVRQGRFREDLWFRLNVFPIIIPPLRRRKEDIPALVHHFVERKCQELKLKERPRLAPGALARLLAHDWPGNVRELENLVERALIRGRGGDLAFEDLLPQSEPGRGECEASEPLRTLDELVTLHIRQALERARGKISGPGGAADLLGLHPNTLRKKMGKLGIPFGRAAETETAS